MTLPTLGNSAGADNAFVAIAFPVNNFAKARKTVQTPRVGARSLPRMTVELFGHLGLWLELRLTKPSMGREAAGRAGRRLARSRGGGL